MMADEEEKGIGLGFPPSNPEFAAFEALGRKLLTVKKKDLDRLRAGEFEPGDDPEIVAGIEDWRETMRQKGLPLPDVGTSQP